MRQYSTNDKQWIVRAFVLAVLDVIFIAGGYFLALMARFDFIYSHIGANYLTGYRQLIIPYCVSAVVIFYIFRLYRHRRLYHKGTLLRQQADTLPASYPQNA